MRASLSFFPARTTLLLLAVASVGFLPEEESWLLADPAPAIALRPPFLEAAGSSACAACHASLVDAWSRTAHAVSWVDELYQDALDGRERPELCHGCHIPAPLLQGEETRGVRARAASHEFGVSCEACHLGDDGVVFGPHGAPTAAHPTARSPLLAEESSKLCARCHATNIGPVIGVAKDFEDSNQAARGRSCVGCHMATLERVWADGDGWSEAGEPRPGRSHALQTPRDPAFLRRAFAFSLAEGPPRVVVANRAGHRVPGLIGRLLRFEAQVLDAHGAVVGRGALELDAIRHLPVDGTRDLVLDARGCSVRLVGLHADPRMEGNVRFLELELSWTEDG